MCSPASSSVAPNVLRVFGALAPQRVLELVSQAPHAVLETLALSRCSTLKYACFRLRDHQNLYSIDARQPYTRPRNSEVDEFRPFRYKRLVDSQCSC